VEAIVTLLELRRVGWIIAHPPREEGFFLSGNEIITAAELQLEAANGIADTPFVTVSVSLRLVCWLPSLSSQVTITNDDKVSACGYQVSKQCMEMAAEGALGLSLNLGTCNVNPPFSAIMEGKESREVLCRSRPPHRSPACRLTTISSSRQSQLSSASRQSSCQPSRASTGPYLPSPHSPLLLADSAAIGTEPRLPRPTTSSSNSPVRGRRAGPCSICSLTSNCSSF
jgi:hypothetical protein